MMEIKQGILVFFCLLSSLIYGLFVMFGGRDVRFLYIPQRVWGRVIAPLTFVTLVIGLSWVSQSFRPQYLIAYLLYPLTHILGYGGSDWKTKIFRRTLWSLSRTSVAGVFVTSVEDFTLLILQVCIGLLATLVLGLLNPLKAPQEEYLISFFNLFIVSFMVVD